MPTSGRGKRRGIEYVCIVDDDLRHQFDPNARVLAARVSAAALRRVSSARR